MTGRIVSVNISPGKGTPKTPVASAVLVEGRGLEKDAHAAPGARQVSLLAQESISKMRQKGVKGLHAGVFAENLTVRGLDIWSLPVGTELRVGKRVVLRISQIGKECHAGCAIRKVVGDCVMPREGVFAEVVVGGIVRKGDKVVI
jgi:MOSC domain-containing protein YiiM